MQSTQVQNLPVREIDEVAALKGKINDMKMKYEKTILKLTHENEILENEIGCMKEQQAKTGLSVENVKNESENIFILDCRIMKNSKYYLTHLAQWLTNWFIMIQIQTQANYVRVATRGDQNVNCLLSRKYFLFWHI